MNVSLSVAVMAHPKRAEMVEDLLKRLDAPATVVWDKINDRHDTGVRSLEAFDPNCTHHMVIQDDALPCRDLVAGVTEALKWVPVGHPLSMYVGTLRPRSDQVAREVRKATKMGASFLRMEKIHWGPCIAVPTAALPELCEWYRRTEHVRGYDKRTSRWFEGQQRECWYTWPCLVNHRGDDSLHLDFAGKRRAHSFPGEDASATDIDWSGPVFTPEGVARWDARRQRKADMAAQRTARRSRMGTPA